MANHKAELKKRVPWENDKRNLKNNTEKKMFRELIIELAYIYTLLIIHNTLFVNGNSCLF